MAAAQSAQYLNALVARRSVLKNGSTKKYRQYGAAGRPARLREGTRQLVAAQRPTTSEPRPAQQSTPHLLPRTPSGFVPAQNTSSHASSWPQYARIRSPAHPAHSAKLIARMSSSLPRKCCCTRHTPASAGNTSAGPQQAWPDMQQCSANCRPPACLMLKQVVDSSTHSRVPTEHAQTHTKYDSRIHILAVRVAAS